MGFDGTMDVNKFYKVAREDIKSLIGGAGIGKAVIYNDTDAPVTFNIYNYIDIVYAIPAQKTLVAGHHYGTVAASGVQFKVHPNNNHDHEFLVEPGKAYVYNGPGKVTQRVDKSSLAGV
jgi:hypothetical protein